MGPGRIILGAALAASLAWGAPGRCPAQIVYGDDPSATMRLVVTSWKTEGERNERLTQTLVPVFGYLPLGNDAEGRIYLAHVANSLETAGGTDRLGGFTDARFQVNKSFGEDRLLLSAGASLPTGKTGLDLGGDLRVTTALSRDFLSYPNRRLGEGLGLNLLAGGAAVLGTTRLGGSLSYHWNGNYTAFAGQGKYRPGSYLRLYGGARRQSGPVEISGGVALIAYGDDTLDGRSAYNRGTQGELQLGAGYARPDFRASLQGQVFLRGGNEIFDLAGSQPSQVDLYGDEFALTASCSWFLRGRTLEVGPLIDLRTIGANGLGLGSSHTLGLGVQGYYRLTAALRCGLGFRGYTGQADGGALDLSGSQVAVSIGGVL